MTGYTNGDWEHLSAYVRRLADLVRLRDYEIELRHDRPDPGYSGQSQMTWGVLKLNVWIDPGLVLNRPQLRQTIIHELLHAHFDRSRNAFLDRFAGEPEGDSIDAVLYRQFKREWEICLDTMATIVAESLPLIEPFPEGGD